MMLVLERFVYASRIRHFECDGDIMPIASSSILPRFRDYNVKVESDGFEDRCNRNTTTIAHCYFPKKKPNRDVSKLSI